MLGPVLGSALLLVDFRVAAVTAAVIFAVLTVAQAFVLPARKADKHDGSVLADWRERATNRRFVAFTLALSGMFALQNQLYLGGSAAVLAGCATGTTSPSCARHDTS